MRKVLMTAVVLSLIVVSSSFAQFPSFTSCPGSATVSGKLTSPAEYTISWQPVPGAVFYQIEETINQPTPDRFTRTVATNARSSFTFTHESTIDIPYRYRIVAIGNQIECQMTALATVKGDPELRRVVRRGIVPVVGSARGANGAQFKTYLSLEGSGLHGKVIFHPAGNVASDSDPSIEYDLRSAARVEWEDVVAAIGQSGIGSLSIVPAEGEQGVLPRATVRLYNVASNGIFGANAEMYPAVDFLDVNAPFQKIDVPIDGNFRANVGVRAIFGGTARGFAITKDGLQKRVIERTFAAGETVFGSPEAVYGVSLEPGESLVLTFTRAMIPFYTLTDNRTNDPFLYVQGAERTDIVDQYAK